MGTSRRGSARWASTRAAVEADVDVLIPTARNGAELAVTLAGLAAQDDPRFSVIIGDQSGNGVTRSLSPLRRVCSSSTTTYGSSPVHSNGSRTR